MTLVFADRVKESTTSTGTGPLTLGGAESGFRAFSSVCVDGDTAYYCVTDGTSWEVGLGTFAAGVLSRSSVLSSSNGGALVALNPGPKDVFLTVPASVVAALQAEETYVGPIGGLPAPAIAGQLAYASDLHYAAFVCDPAGAGGADFYVQGAPGAVMSGAGAPSATDYVGGTLAVAHTAGYVAYAFNGATWQPIGATDATARSAAAAAQSTANGAASDVGVALTLFPVFGAGNPTATSQPLDGSVVKYYDTTASPYVHYVFDGAAFHQVA